MVKSEKIYSPQEYLELVTGNCYAINGNNDIEQIEFILNKFNHSLWNYPLSEIDHIVENNLDVVLVDCMVWNEKAKDYDHCYRWFEAPENIEE